MDGESCVMKYIDIVPVDNSRNYSDSSHVDFDPSRIKVEVDEDTEPNETSDIVNTSSSVHSSIGIPAVHQMLHEPSQTSGHELQNTALTYRSPADDVPSTSDECRQQEDQSDALSNTVTSSISDTEDIDVQDDCDMLCSLISRYSHDVGHGTFSSADEILAAQQSDDDTETPDTFQHMFPESGPRIKPYICDICRKEFSQLDTAKRHRLTHTDGRPYKCHVCLASFARLRDLKVHHRTHPGEKPYICDTCCRGFARLRNLKIHERSHTGERPYRCDVCQMSFAQLGHLNSHKPVHSDDKPYKCDVCAMSFSRRSALTLHKPTHTGAKPFTCAVCQKSFARLCNLRTHENIHSGEKPYKCDVCGMSFAQPSVLNRHKFTHTGEKPYTCDRCHKGYTQLGSLKRHKCSDK